MPIKLILPFPSEAESLRKQVAAEQLLTATERLHAVIDLLAAAEALSKAGKVRSAQLKYHADLEFEWRRRMKEFIANHVVPG